MVGRRRRPFNVDTDVVFAEPVWDHTTPAWQEIDSRIPDNHLARQIDAAVDGLDLGQLVASYHGRGTPALRPDLMLKLVMLRTRMWETFARRLVPRHARQ